ncbi:hypothetical protein J7E73_23975 [Paenibacillus albidus]|uniref:hypothetical protein n=1 Tax=Paenibacillus albidus TaxID=2041023 RepID=UPI001BE75E13|nr:hypothetical protein [Paenibacillus albidus]MBT2292136.1 hypothetical protein [Paenibacillus albidus]
MSRSRIYEQDGLEPDQANPELWPSVDENVLNETAHTVYIQRKNAVLMYFRRDSLDSIQHTTGVSPRNLRRLVQRCIQYDQDGVVLGFRGLIPQKNVKKYELDILSQKRNKDQKTGEFNRFLELHPDIKDMVEDLYLGRKKRSLEPVMKIKHIHKRFIDQCRQKGITLSEYPLNTKWMGYKALQRYIKQLSEQNFSKTAARYGNDAFQKANRVGEADQNSLSNVYPYQKVQFDAHRIDGFFAVDLVTPDGDLVTKTLERFWILTIIDVSTRNILGYSICLSREYGGSDVMQCARNAVMPHKRVELTIPGLSYHEDGGFPAEKLPELEWAVSDVICLDNAKSHYAKIVQDRLTNLIGCTPNFGPVALPMRRGVIERFFKNLAESLFHRLPNTTGSGINDPKRNNPEEKALKLNITYDHLLQLVDVIISNYNGTPHQGIYQQSPLELMEKRIRETGLLPRRLEDDKRSEMLFMQTSIKRTVRGSLKSGRKPYIQYEGVEYRSERLANSAYLLNSELVLHVNVDDLRTLKAFLPDGSEFGYLIASGRWSLTAHSLQTRRAINSLVLKKLIHYTTWDDPIFVYTDYLMSQKNSKKSTNKITQVNEIRRKKPTDSTTEQSKALEEAKVQHELLDKVREEQINREKLNEMDNYDRLIKQFKTKY